MTTDQILQAIVLCLLFVGQVILPIVLVFNFKDGSTLLGLLITMVTCATLMFILQCVRVSTCKAITDKWKFLIKTQLFFVPNYVMTILSIFLLILTFLIDELSIGTIFLFSFYYLMHVEVYTLLVHKEFMNKKTYVIGQLSLIIWMVLITFQSIGSKLQDKDSQREEYRSTILIAYLGISSGIIKSCMEYMKNNFNLWLADQQKNKELEQTLQNIEQTIDQDNSAKNGSVEIELAKVNHEVGEFPEIAKDQR